MTNLCLSNDPQSSNQRTLCGFVSEPFLTHNGCYASNNCCFDLGNPLCFVRYQPIHHHYPPYHMLNYRTMQNSPYNYPMQHPCKHIPNLDKVRRSKTSTSRGKPFKNPSNTQVRISSFLQKTNAKEKYIKEEETNAVSSSTEHEAAKCIQSWYRAYAVRRCESIKKLKQLAQVREKLPELRRQFEDLEVCFDQTRIIYLGEQIMKALLQLDSVQNLHESLRDLRKCLANELLGLQERLDSLQPHLADQCEPDRNDVNEKIDTIIDENGRLFKENERLREMVDDLLKAGSQYFGIFSQLNDRVNHLEKKLSTRKTIRKARF